MRRNTLYPAQLHGAIDHHWGRTLAGTCPEPAQTPHDATHRLHPAISNRESIRLETPATHRNESPTLLSNRECNALLKCPHPIRVGAVVPGGSPLIHEREERFSAPKRQRNSRCALAPGIATNRSEQLTTRNQQNDLIIQIKTTSKHKKHPSKFVSVRKNSVLYFLQLSEILIEPMFRLERKSSQRGAQRKRSTSSTGTPACGTSQFSVRGAQRKQSPFSKDFHHFPAIFRSQSRSSQRARNISSRVPSNHSKAFI